jgi:hypothetical protein
MICGSTSTPQQQIMATTNKQLAKTLSIEYSAL